MWILKSCSLAVFGNTAGEKQKSDAMCFSAGASFRASAVIGAISVACFVKAKDPAQKVWACIPLFFAIQQAIEGALWLSMTHAHLKLLAAPAMYGFLLFAQVIWPAMIPIAAFAPERDARRKKILRGFLWLGAGVAVYHLVALLIYTPQAMTAEHNIHYELGQPRMLRTVGDALYFITAVLPLFISSLRPVRWMGGVLVVSYVLSRIFYQENVISIWCYLAALMSVVVFWIIGKIGKANEPAPLKASRPIAGKYT